MTTTSAATENVPVRTGDSHIAGGGPLRETNISQRRTPTVGYRHVYRMWMPSVVLRAYRTWITAVPWRFYTVFPCEVEPNANDKELLFRQEKAAFAALLPMLLAQYPGRFVAIHNGAVVDTDPSRTALARRFVQTHGDTHVYIGYVGEQQPVAYQISPFRH